MSYLAELFNNKGPKGLYKHLRDSLYVDSLYSMPDQKFVTNQVFQIAIRLTTLGYKEIEWVVSLVFGYIEHLKSVDLDAGLYEYLKKNSKMSFLTEHAESSVTSIASSWNHYGLHKIFIQDNEYTQFDKKEV